MFICWFTFREELAAKEENKGPSIVGEDDEITALRAQLKESEASRITAEEKVLD